MRRGVAASRRFLLAVLGVGMAFVPWMGRDLRADTPAGLKISIGFVHEAVPEPAPLSPVEPVASDKGLAGARLAIVDDNTTGRFLGQHYELKEVTVPAGGDLDGAVKSLIAGGTTLIVADLSAKRLLEVADLPEAKLAVILNTAAEEDELRARDCRANLFHIIPSRAMKADALAQYLTVKRWQRWVLVSGTEEGDKAFAAAIRRAAKRFGDKIVAERSYTYTSGSRRTDTGEAQIQKQMTELTQRLPDYDIMIVADEGQIFGDYLPYRTWDPRQVAGTQGLVPTAWHRSTEQWGGTQLQHRFIAAAKRWMLERDYTAWAGVRALGEAVTRTGKTDPQAIKAYLLSDQFQLGAFKGVGLSFRRWDQQLRQPVLLSSPLMLVSVSPQDGFLHPGTNLDTLGYDAPEAKCNLNP
jgi:ABC transporter substrate binding protein (PQQ-dependent alcohol dehydrogenase system)